MSTTEIGKSQLRYLHKALNLAIVLDSDRSAQRLANVRNQSDLLSSWF